MNFAQLIKSEREKLNLNQKDFASKINVANSTLNAWENDVRQPAAHSVMSLANHIGWSDAKTLKIVSDLEGGEDWGYFERLLWKTSLKLIRLHYKDKHLALLLGINTKTLSSWKTQRIKAGKNAKARSIERLEEILEWTDEEVKVRVEQVRARGRRRTAKERMALHKERKRVLEKYNNLGIEIREMTDEQLAEVQKVYGVI